MKKYHIYKILGAFYSEKLEGLEYNTLKEAEKEAKKLEELSGREFSFFAK